MPSIAVSFRFSVVLVRDIEHTPLIAHIDGIKWLKDSDLFYDELSKEVHRSNLFRSSESTHEDPLGDRNTVLNLLGTR
jgi:hypothetical protein